MAIKVDDALLAYMRGSSGAIHFEVREANDRELALEGLRRAGRDIFRVRSPEEPDEPYASFASDVEEGARGPGFWVDMADAEAYEGFSRRRWKLLSPPFLRRVSRTPA